MPSILWLSTIRVLCFSCCDLHLLVPVRWISTYAATIWPQHTERFLFLELGASYVSRRSSFDAPGDFEICNEKLIRTCNNYHKMTTGFINFIIIRLLIYRTTLNLILTFLSVCFNCCCLGHFAGYWPFNHCKLEELCKICMLLLHCLLFKTKSFGELLAD